MQRTGFGCDGPCLMGQGVHQVVDTQAIGRVGIPRGVGRMVGVFPAITHIGVPVYQHHDASSVIHDGMVTGIVYALLTLLI